MTYAEQATCLTEHPEEIKTIKGEYGQSVYGNFKVIDTIGVPHPYMITPKHVEIAADHHGGILGEAAIMQAEHCGVRCGFNCQLSYKEHGIALLIECDKELKDKEGKADPELHKYLLEIKDKATKNGYVGFAFKRAFAPHNEGD